MNGLLIAPRLGVTLEILAMEMIERDLYDVAGGGELSILDVGWRSMSEARAHPAKSLPAALGILQAHGAYNLGFLYTKRTR